MTIAQTLTQVEASLRGAGLEDARAEAEFLVAGALQIPRTHLMRRRQEELTAAVAENVEEWTIRRAKREPLAYLIGEQPFIDLVLAVDSSVLIPRPETEELVEKALELLSLRNASSIVCDVGTGSGAIGLALASHEVVSKVLAIDISKEALAVAEANAHRLQLTHKWQKFEGDLLTPLRANNIQVDLIVANLPYIATEVIKTLSPEVQQEPKLALDGGMTGTEVLARLISEAPKSLRPGGYLMLEIGWDQANWVRKQLNGSGWTNGEIFKDLSGHARIVQVQKEGGEWIS